MFQGLRNTRNNVLVIRPDKILKATTFSRFVIQKIVK